jgi:hypothetical protein
MAQATRSARPLELALNMALQHMAAYRCQKAGRTALISDRANG